MMLYIISLRGALIKVSDWQVYFAYQQGFADSQLIFSIARFSESNKFHQISLAAYSSSILGNNSFNGSTVLPDTLPIYVMRTLPFFQPTIKVRSSAVCLAFSISIGPSG